MSGEAVSHGPIGPRRVRVIVAHADPLTRRAVRDVLADEGGFTVLAEAADGVAAVELALFYRPEIVLADVALPRRDGIAVARAIAAAAPSVRVVMFSDRGDAATATAALQAGACGFLSTAVDLGTLAQALRAVSVGGAALSAELAMHLVARVRGTSERGMALRSAASLTTREWDVLDMICAGLSTREISGVLFVAEDTVCGAVNQMLHKLGVKSRPEAVSGARTLREVTDGA